MWVDFFLRALKLALEKEWKDAKIRSRKTYYEKPNTVEFKSFFLLVSCCYMKSTVVHKAAYLPRLLKVLAIYNSISRPYKFNEIG